MCRRFVGLIVAIALALSAAQTVRVEAARGEMQPIDGPTVKLPIPLTAVTNVVVDDANQRVYLLSEADAAILTLDYFGNQISLRSALARPNAIAVGGGSAYALLSGSSQIVRLNPDSAATTMVASGLENANGLAYSAGSLYTFTNAQRLDSPLNQINPTNGAVTLTSIRYSYAGSLKLFAFAQHPGVLYGSGPSSTDRWDLATGQRTYGSDIPQRVAVLPNGNLVFANFGSSSVPPGLAEVTADTFQSTGRSWQLLAYDPLSFAVGTRAVATGGGATVQLASVEQPARIYRTFTIGDWSATSSVRLGITADSSRVFAAFNEGGINYFSSLPGVSVESAPSATNASATYARGAAPAAVGVTQTRSSVAPAQGSVPFPMNTVTDIEFATDGTVYASDRFNGVVNRYAADGNPIGAWQYLAGAESLAELNGTMYVVLGREGSIVRLDPTTMTSTVIASGINQAGNLTAANGKLWTTYAPDYGYDRYMASVNPLTGALWRQPVGYPSFGAEPLELGEVAIGNHLLGGYSGYGRRFNLNTLAFENEPQGPRTPFSISPNGQWVIDRDGERWSTAPYQRDAVTFLGGGVMSGPTPGGRAYVAARTGTLEDSFVVVDESNPAIVVYRQPRVDRQVVQRLEFRPGTTQLWVAVQNTRVFDNGFSVYPIDIGPAGAPAQVEVSHNAATIPAATVGSAAAATAELQPTSATHPDPSPDASTSPSSSVTPPTLASDGFPSSTTPVAPVTRVAPGASVSPIRSGPPSTRKVQATPAARKPATKSRTKADSSKAGSSKAGSSKAGSSKAGSSKADSSKSGNHSGNKAPTVHSTGSPAP